MELVHRDARAVHPCACEQQVGKKSKKQGERRLGRSMKYGKKESGHERKSSKGLAVLGYQGVAMSSADLN